MMTAIKFAKVRPNAKIPTKRLEDAGLDIYACFDEPYMIINPHETVMIPTGIASACDVDYCLVLKERGSTGTKGMAQRSGIIDSGFHGEIFVPITNTTNKIIVIPRIKIPEIPEMTSDEFEKLNEIGLLSNQTGKDCIIYPYEKAICQALVIPVPELDIEEYTYDELKTIPSKRGSGCLGSTGK
jgi:dUTP pyrophosphatase